MPWIALKCPMCDHAIGRASEGSVVELRCHARRCAAKPVITFRVQNGHASPLRMVDRREHKRVESA